MRARGWQPRYPLGSSTAISGVPILASSRWDTGVEARWRNRAVEVSGAVTRGSPAAPVVRETNSGLQWSGRAALTVAGGAVVGVSGSRAAWLDDNVLVALPAPLRDHRQQSVVGIDAEFGRSRWLLRGEWLQTRFDLPVRDAPDPRLQLTASAAFAEVRYRLHPRWQLAGRAGYLEFSDVTGTVSGTNSWDATVRRLEAVLSYRVTRRIDLRTGWQHNWRDGGRVRAQGFPMVGSRFWF